ncbi:uncharacterized protein V6R79_025458 [Siganus canaliculatus]
MDARHGRSVHQLPSQTATIRRKPSSKPAYRRGTISGGVPIPISTPQVPPRGSNENVFTAPSAGGAKSPNRPSSLHTLSSSSFLVSTEQLKPSEVYHFDLSLLLYCPLWIQTSSEQINLTA